MDKEQLIALMLINQVPSTDIVTEISAQYDLDTCEIEALIEEYQKHPIFQASQSIQQELTKRDWLLNQLDSVFGTNIDFTVDTVNSIEEEDFYTRYYRVNRPLVIKGYGKAWPAVKHWNFDYLKNKWGDCEVEVQFNRSQDPLYDQNHDAHTKEIAFSEYLDLVQQAGHSNDIYMTSRNMKKNDVAFQGLLDEIRPLPSILDENYSSTIAFLWVGPQGAKTQLHHDMSNNLHAQVLGKKRFKLASPYQLPNMYHYNNYWSRVAFPESVDLQKYPLIANTRFAEVILEPGDAIFIPVFWWHWVESLIPTVSVAFHNFKENNTFVDFNSNSRFSYHQEEITA